MPDYNCEKYPSIKFGFEMLVSIFTLVHHSKLVDSQKVPAVCKWQDYRKQWQDRCGEGEYILCYSTNGEDLCRYQVSFKYVISIKWLERRGRFHQLIKNSKKRRDSKVKVVEKDKRNQEMIDCIQQQAGEIEHLKEKLD